MDQEMNEVNIKEHVQKDEKDIKGVHESYIVGIIFIIIEFLLILGIGLMFKWDGDYHPETDVENYAKKTENINYGTLKTKENYTAEEKIGELYYVQVSLMIFVGFGFLYAYIQTHSLASVAINLLMGVLGVQMALFSNRLWECAFEKKDTWKGKNYLYIGLITKALTNAGSLLVAFGAVIGRLSFLQYAIMSILGCFFITFNQALCEGVLRIIDTGGSLYVHTFGAIFGCCVSIAMTIKTNEKQKYLSHKNKGGNQTSHLVAFIGTVFLWIYWPYFNICLSESNVNRGMLNTIFALFGSLMGAGIASLFLNKGKLDIEHMLNATFAGGVIIGGCCTVCGYFWAAILIGFLGGAVSSLCFAKVKPFFEGLGLLDSAGVLNIHGIPGILGGIFTAIFIGALRIKKDQLWNPFSDADLPKELYTIIYKVGYPNSYKIRSRSQQGGFQIIGVCITIGIAVLSGFFVGFITRIVTLGKNKNYFSDDEFFKEEMDEEENKLNIDNSRMANVISIKQMPTEI